MEIPQERSLMILFPGSEHLKRVRLHLKSDMRLQVLDAANAKEVQALLSEHGSGILLFCIRDKDDLRLVADTLLELSEPIQAKHLQVLGSTKIENAKAWDLLTKRGCSDLFPTLISWKALESKIRRARQILEEHLALERIGDPLPLQDRDRRELKVWVGSSRPDEELMLEANPLEFGGDYLVLDVSKHCFASGDSVLLILDNGAPFPHAKLKLNAMLGEIIQLEDGRETVTVRLEGRVRDHLLILQKEYEKLQRGVSDFMKAARGW